MPPLLELSVGEQRAAVLLVPFLITGAAILVAQPGKRTLAVRIGRGATRWEYMTLTALAYAMPGLMWWSTPSEPWPLLAWTTAPLALHLVRLVWDVDGRGLNPVLVCTAGICLWFAVTLSAGIVL